MDWTRWERVTPRTLACQIHMKTCITIYIWVAGHSLLSLTIHKLAGFTRGVKWSVIHREKQHIKYAFSKTVQSTPRHLLFCISYRHIYFSKCDRQKISATNFYVLVLNWKILQSSIHSGIHFCYTRDSYLPVATDVSSSIGIGIELKLRNALGGLLSQCNHFFLEKVRTLIFTTALTPAQTRRVCV